MTTTQQGTENTARHKNAADLKPGDFIIDPDLETVEVRCNEPAEAQPGYVALMLAGGYVLHYQVDQPVTLATEEEVTRHRNLRAWAQVMEQVQSWLRWMGENADRLPPPTSIDLEMHRSLVLESDDQKRCAAAIAAEALGLTVVEEPAYKGANQNEVGLRFKDKVRTADLDRELSYTVHGYVTPLAVDEPVDKVTVDPAPIWHRLAGIGAACQMTLRLIDGCTDDPAKVTCAGCIGLSRDDGDPDAEPVRLIEPAPQVDPALANRDETDRIDEADCDDPWHLDTGEVAPTAPCDTCGAVAGPTVGA